MDEEEEYTECINTQADEFSTYDQYVDVVSCWEEFLTNQYSGEFPSFFFDRFPSIPQLDSNPLTPDFTTYFNDEYGIIFEVSRTMPKGDEEFDNEIDQLRKYDSGLPIRSDNGRQEPEKCDIVLLVGSIDSFTIADRVSSMIDSGDLSLESSLILVEYMYTEQDSDAGYQFRRVPILDQNLRDDVLPDGRRLSKKMSSEGEGYDNIFIPPNFFHEYKVSGVLCNDDPPPVYLACYLWNKVLYDYLTDSQRKTWQRGNPSKILEVSIEVEDLKEKLNNEYIPDGFIRRGWLVDTFDYLKVADLAEKESDGEYVVKFRNLTKKRNKYRSSKKTEFSDLADIFSEWYCQGRVRGDIDSGLGDDESDESGDVDQSSLSQFDN